MNRVALTIALAASLVRPLWADPPTPQGALSSAEALDQFEILPGYRLELVACEPLVVDPVEIRFDEKGQLWVVEMGDYPHGPAEGEPPTSRIRVLRDDNLDGRFDSATTFAENLLFANGIQPWRGGVIVTLAGEVAYLKDTTGDGIADHRETWFRGLAEQNPQLRSNHPRFGPDNRIYVNNGLRSQHVVDVRTSMRAEVSIAGRDFRFDPLGGQLEPVTGNGQFGLTFDAFGNRFVCSNRNPLMHVVLEEHHLQRNPNFPISTAVYDVASAAERSRVFPLSRAFTTSIQHAGQFTAASGVLIYAGDMLTEFEGNSFTCEPTGNLIHREILVPNGPTFTGRPGRAGVEFLASPDEWFRPVNLELGPDGALYVVDMYRAVIEHPQFMPAELKTRRDLRAGDDKGRIYRIVPETIASQKSHPGFQDRATSDWIKLLDHENAWWRRTAARSIYEHGIDATNHPTRIEDIEHIALKSPRPASRVAAIQVLAGQDTLSSETLLACLQADDASVRAVAVHWAERYLGDDTRLRDSVVALANDPEPRVRFRVALCLARIDPALRVAPLADIAVRDEADTWMRRAVSTSADGCAAEVFTQILNAPTREIPDGTRSQVLTEFAALTGASVSSEEAKQLLGFILDRADDPDFAPRAMSSLTGFAEGLSRRQIALTSLLAEVEKADDRHRASLLALFNFAIVRATDSATNTPARVDAIRLLALAPFQLVKSPLQNLLVPQTDELVLTSAVAALSAHNEGDVAAILLGDYSSHVPAVQRAILDALLVNESRQHRLLDAVENGDLSITEIDPARALRLRRSASGDVTSRTERIFADARPQDRARVLEEYQSVLSMTGDPTRGREVFRRTCASCHRVGGIGHAVGPEVGDSYALKPAQLLVDVLEPNRAIDGNYFAYAVETVDGRAITGIIRSQTATSVTIVEADGKTHTLLRQEIAELASTKVSLMPVGLENDVSPQAMADLIAFLLNWRYLDGKIPLD